MEGYYESHTSSGYCIIVNNSVLVGKEEIQHRTGSRKDAEDIERVFKTLGFMVISRENLTKRETLDLMEEIAAIDHSDQTCLFVFLLSHGHMEVVYSTSFESIHLSEVLSPFTSCTTLANKPKIFVVQACRDLTGDNISLSLQQNFLIAYATASGNKAARHIDEGSPYIQEFLKVIENPKDDFASMLVTVHKNVRSCYSFQIPEFRSALEKKLNFQTRRTSSNSVLVPGPTRTVSSASSIHLTVSPSPSCSTYLSTRTGSEVVLPENPLPRFLRPSTSLEPVFSESVPSNLAISASEEQDVYDVSHVPCGYCIIIDNYVNSDHSIAFRNHVRELAHLFQNGLSFHVETFTGLSCGAINMLLDSLTMVDHSQLCCFALIILSHGNTRDIYGVDGECMPVNSVLNKFSDTNCSSLVQKPKLFILQTYTDVALHVTPALLAGVQYNPPSDGYLLFSTPEQNQNDGVLSHIMEGLTDCNSVENLFKDTECLYANCKVVCRPNFKSSFKLKTDQPRQDHYPPDNVHKNMVNDVWNHIAKRTRSVLTDSNTKMKKTSKKARIARITGSSLSIIGGIVSTAGFILVPFTLGGSIAIIIVGSGIGFTGGMTSVIANVAKKAKSKKRLKKIRKTIDDYEAISNEICSIVAGIESHLRGRDTAVFASGNAVVSSLHVAAGVSGSGMATAGAVYSATTSASLSLQIAQMALTTTVVATGLGIGGVSLLVVASINVVDIVYNVKLLKKGSKTSRWLQGKIDTLQEIPQTEQFSNYQMERAETTEYTITAV